MPLMVRKTMEVVVHHVQMRRIQCAHCPSPYTVVHGSSFSSQAQGVPVLSSDDGMRRNVMKGVRKIAKRVARKERAGVARCPSCNQVQGWMSRHVWLTRLGGTALLLMVVGGVLGAIAAAVLDLSMESALSWGAVLGLAAGTALGALLAQSELRGPRGDPRGMSDSDLMDLIRQADEHEADAALYWWYGILGFDQPPEDQLLLSFGLLDTLGNLRVPEHHTTEYAVGRLDWRERRRNR